MSTNQNSQGANQLSAESQEPVFGCIILGGAVNGATNRDVRLANELARRGYRVHVWWAMDRPQSQVLDRRIQQHWLFHGFRYAGRPLRTIKDCVGRAVSALNPDERRARFSQARPKLLDMIWHGHVRLVCAGIERDARRVRRFAQEVARAGVTHMLPALAILSPWAAAAKKLVPHQMRYVVTFQGYEIYGNYARELALEKEFYSRIADMVRQSDWPAIAVSEAYANRIVSEIGLSRDQLTVLPPGVPVPEPLDRQSAVKMVRKEFATYNPNIPLVSFVGRRDTEKGIDLLLYATKLLRQRGHSLQVYVCGATAFGHKYSAVCQQIAQSLRTRIVWRDYISDDLRSALYAASRFVVYPSIHEEPFGMVPVEAMSQETPAIVPDQGGVARAISARGQEGGLRFRTWDSGDLAQQMERLLEDDELHGRLVRACREVAAHYSVTMCASRMLKHLDIPPRKQSRVNPDQGNLRPAA